MRDDLKKLEADFNKQEDDLKAVQNVGQIIGEVLKRLDEERCTPMAVMPHLSSPERSCRFRCCSHREGLEWSSLRGRLPNKSKQGQAGT